tara:strand:- start:138 stop:1322 length:1185 start_codon:yes stop_codon:yes gene_type:complete
MPSVLSLKKYRKLNGSCIGRFENNNLKTLALLVVYPLLTMLGLGIVMTVLIRLMGAEDAAEDIEFDEWLAREQGAVDWLGWLVPHGYEQFYLQAAIIITLVIGGWYVIAYLRFENLTDYFTGARRVERRDMPKLYNTLENLCISRGLQMPGLGLIKSSKLNAFASGCSNRTYRITITSGLVDTLDDEAMEAVLAHELAHILNRDVHLMAGITIFTGILALFAHMAFHGGGRPGQYQASESERHQAVFLYIGFSLVACVPYMISIVLRSFITSGRDYMADAGACELTKNPEALIRAIRIISPRSHLSDFDNEMRLILFDNSKKFLGIFGTHPFVDDRIGRIQKVAHTSYDFLPRRRSSRRVMMDSAIPSHEQIRTLGLGTRHRKRRKGWPSRERH